VRSKWGGDQLIKTNEGAIDFCEAANFCCGGDPSVSKERQNRGDFYYSESLLSGGGGGDFCE